MNSLITYGIIFVILLALELIYFKVADKFNIIDKPNERSSHSTIVLRGGGVIFLLGAWVWALKGFMVDGLGFMDCYPWMLAAVTLAAGISFIDDIHSLPDSVRLVVQFVAMGLMFYQLDMMHLNLWWLVLISFIVCVGASNIINFMDGVNGITGGYSLAVLVPLLVVNENFHAMDSAYLAPLGSDLLGQSAENFMDQSFLIVAITAVVVFCLFNFRPRGKAKCFAGDVGSIGIAFIMLFAIGKLIMATGDLTWLIFLLVYGVDGGLTIIHRIMLHENLGKAHRKHAYQLMANELKMSHPLVSSIYMALQLMVSFGFIYLCPNTVLAHWVYLIGALIVLSIMYVLFKRKYYHLHEEYLASLKK